MTQFKLIYNKRFGPLFLTQSLGALNDNIFKNSLVIFIAFSLTGAEQNSSIMVIIAAGIFILPFFLFSAIAGQIADKYEKSQLIRGIKLAEIVIMMLATVAYLLVSLPLLMFVLFLMGTQSTLFGPLKYGILPQHLEPEELTGGNGMIQMGTYLAILFGTILGGVLIAIKPGGNWYVSCVVITVAICGWLASRHIPVARAADPSLEVSVNIVRKTWDIIAHARKNMKIFWAIIGISWFWFYGATFLSLVPSYTKQILLGNEHVTTILLTAFSVGIGTGSLMCEKISARKIEPGLSVLGAIGLSVFATDLYFIDLSYEVLIAPGKINGAFTFMNSFDNWRILFDLSLIGFFGGLYIVPLYAYVQNLSAEKIRSRIIAANNILNALFMVLSALLTIGLISMGFSIPQIFLVMAIMNILIISLICRQVPEIISRFFNLVRRLAGIY